MLAALAIFVSSKFLVLGVLISLWALISQIIVPSCRHGYQLYRIISSRRRRIRFVLASLTIGITLGLLLFWLPVPHTSRSEGVVTVQESSQIRAGTDCFVTEVLARNSDEVTLGQPLLRCEDPFLAAEVEVHTATLLEARARYTSEPPQARVRREILQKEIDTAADALKHAADRLAELEIVSPSAGRLILPEAHKLPGSHVRQGSVLGYILSPRSARVVAAVGQEDIALVRDLTSSVDLRFASQPSTTIRTTVSREIPGANDRLPSPVLGTEGGGSIPVDPTDPDQTRTLSPTFQVEIEVMGVSEARIGERVYLRFNHGHSSIARQWFQLLRNLFLRTFHV